MIQHGTRTLLRRLPKVSGSSKMGGDAAHPVSRLSIVFREKPESCSACTSTLQTRKVRIYPVSANGRI